MSIRRIQIQRRKQLFQIQQGEFTITDCRLIDLRKISDPRGNLTPIESFIDVPFQIQRVYYLYDVPGGANRGGHAHKQLQQLIVAVSGSFDVTLYDGFEKVTYQLNRSYTGLLVAPMTWREIDNFSSGSVCMVLASENFSEDDYYRDIIEFENHVRD
jgi:dTDP-4-dehydrorhamnose 3,5-epimerase-like enzyme